MRIYVDLDKNMYFDDRTTARAYRIKKGVKLIPMRKSVWKIPPPPESQWTHRTAYILIKRARWNNIFGVDADGNPTNQTAYDTAISLGIFPRNFNSLRRDIVNGNTGIVQASIPMHKTDPTRSKDKILDSWMGYGRILGYYWKHLSEDEINAGKQSIYDFLNANASDWNDVVTTV